LTIYYPSLTELPAAFKNWKVSVCVRQEYFVVVILFWFTMY